LFTVHPKNDCNQRHSKNQILRATRNVIFQYARDVIEQADSYTSAVELFSSNSLINPIYYIVAGSATGEGAVVTRYREPEKTDVWSINASAVDGWFRLVTNYDHWEEDPTYDDRRTPGTVAQRTIYFVRH
jgi:acid ceramidase